MSVGTNENIKKIEDFNEINNSINTGGPVNNNVVDMQATQKLDFIGELQKDSEVMAKKMLKNTQGSFAPYKKIRNIVKNDEIENVENSGSTVSNEPIAQAESLSAVNVSNEIVQETPNEIINTENTHNDEINNNLNIENDNIEKDGIENKPNQEINIDNYEKNVEENAEEIARKKEKQHAQDKKDFRFERMLFARINTMQGKISFNLLYKWRI